MSVAYKSLEKISYKDEALCESTYQARFCDPSAVHLDFSIHDAPAFYMLPAEAYDSMLQIYKTERDIVLLKNELPGVALEQFAGRCLIDEIVLSNNIEGVSSSRKDISDVLNHLQKQDRKKRFAGMVQKYLLLQSPQQIHLETCQDIRNIYDELLEDEIRLSDSGSLPDGTVFRRDGVSVYSSTGKVIHQGLYPESSICTAMQKALKFLHTETKNPLINTAIFHYLIGYIHPFYDGNGRLARFISSYLLSRDIDPLLGYRLSYTISENIKEYYAAFKTCNNPRNRGDLTPFLIFFLRMVEISTNQLFRALRRRYQDFVRYSQLLGSLPFLQKEPALFQLGSLLLQAELFSEQGISTQELLEVLQISRATLSKRLVVFAQYGLLASLTVGKRKLYGIPLDKLSQGQASLS